MLEQPPLRDTEALRGRGWSEQPVRGDFCLRLQPSSLGDRADESRVEIGVIEDTRFVGVSFFSDFNTAQLVRVSESFSEDGAVGEIIRANDSFGTGIGVPFRFAVVVIPNH